MHSFMTSSSNVKLATCFGWFVFFHISYQVMASDKKLSNLYTISICSTSALNLSLDGAIAWLHVMLTKMQA